MAKIVNFQKYQHDGNHYFGRTSDGRRAEIIANSEHEAELLAKHQNITLLKKK